MPRRVFLFRAPKNIRTKIKPPDISDNGPSDLVCDTPDDDGRGGIIRFAFESPVAVNSIDVFDIDADEDAGTLEFFAFALNGDGDPIGGYRYRSPGVSIPWGRLSWPNRLAG